MSLSALDRGDILYHVFRFIDPNPNNTAPVSKLWRALTQECYYNKVYKFLREGECDVTKSNPADVRRVVSSKAQEMFKQIHYELTAWYCFTEEGQRALTKDDLSFLKSDISFMSRLRPLKAGFVLDDLIFRSIECNDLKTLMLLMQGRARPRRVAHDAPDYARRILYECPSRIYRTILYAIQAKRLPIIEYLVENKFWVPFDRQIDADGQISALIEIAKTYLSSKTYTQVIAKIARKYHGTAREEAFKALTQDDKFDLGRLSSDDLRYVQSAAKQYQMHDLQTRISELKNNKKCLIM